MKIPDKSMVLTNSEYRPCLVLRSPYTKREDSKALFHRWVVKQGTLPTGSQFTTIEALIEFEDGEVESVGVKNVRFIDSKQMFEQFDWSGA